MLLSHTNTLTVHFFFWHEPSEPQRRSRVPHATAAHVQMSRVVEPCGWLAAAVGSARGLVAGQETSHQHLALAAERQRTATELRRLSHSHDRHALHLHGRVRAVVGSRHLRDFHHNVEGLLVAGLAENRVLRLARREPIEEIVVYSVHEELRAARAWLARVGH